MMQLSISFDFPAEEFQLDPEFTEAELRRGWRWLRPGQREFFSDMSEDIARDEGHHSGFEEAIADGNHTVGKGDPWNVQRGRRTL